MSYAVSNPETEQLMADLGSLISELQEVYDIVHGSKGTNRDSRNASLDRCCLRRAVTARARATNLGACLIGGTLALDIDEERRLLAYWSEASVAALSLEEIVKRVDEDFSGGESFGTRDWLRLGGWCRSSIARAETLAREIKRQGSPP